MTDRIFTRRAASDVAPSRPNIRAYRLDTISRWSGSHSTVIDFAYTHSIYGLTLEQETSLLSSNLSTTMRGNT